LKGECEEEEDRLFSVVLSDRTRGNRNKRKHRRVHLNIRKHQALAQVAQRGCGVSNLEDILKPSGHGPGQLALGGPARAIL